MRSCRGAHRGYANERDAELPRYRRAPRRWTTQRHKWRLTAEGEQERTETDNSTRPLVQCADEGTGDAEMFAHYLPAAFSARLSRIMKYT